MLIALAVAALAMPSDPDGVVTTAPRGDGAVLVGAVAPTTDATPDAALAGRVTAQDLTTQEQIDRWISARTPETEPFSDSAAAGPSDDRQMHGFVSGSIGTNDYSNVSVGVSLPIGENGRLDLAYSQTKNGYGYGYGYPGYGLGYPGDYGYGYAGSARRFGRYDPVYGSRESSRNIALGLSWDQDKDEVGRDGRDARRPLRAPSRTAAD
ncbi:MAG: hypothetical protein V4701_10480 [Pseudomonadota bacterium]